MTRRRLFVVPEVVQTSALDCGPAALKCLLEGFGINVSYGRLREACQTDVDGTSIDMLEVVANDLGLNAEQVLLPGDYLMGGSARMFPALVVVRQPGGLTHFVVAWRRHGGYVQVMDPAIGRRWMSARRLIDEAYKHRLIVPGATLREWFCSPPFRDPLTRRMGELMGARAAERLWAWTAAGDGATRFASLDAALRLVGAVRRAGAVAAGEGAARMVTTLAEGAASGGAAAAIPDGHWFAREIAGSPAAPSRFAVQGVVLVRFAGRSSDAKPPSGSPSAARAPLAPELLGSVGEAPPRPMRELWRLATIDGHVTPIAVIATLVCSAAGFLVEALLLRSCFGIGRDIGLVSQRLVGFVTLLVALLTFASLELPIGVGALQLGKRIEARLRMAFLQKIPRLDDQYFGSRLVSDMAERGHALAKLHILPALGSDLLRGGVQLALTTGALIWLAPATWWLALLAAVAALGVPMIGYPVLTERDLRVRTHNGALGRFYLDALLGAVSIRAHGAERSVRREHESLLVHWGLAMTSVQRSIVAVETIQALLGFGLAAGLVLTHVTRSGGTASALLVAYWALELPVLGRAIGLLARQIPVRRNVVLRVLEPLAAPEIVAGAAAGDACPGISRVAGAIPQVAPPGVGVELRDVSVVAGGHAILTGVDLSVPAGRHVAIVGASGSGKSTLLGLLQGWSVPSAGTVRTDGAALAGERLEALRSVTAWVDPTVHLFNRRLIDNLFYGAPLDGAVGQAIDGSDLQGVLERLPEGLQTRLGDGGGSLSGGEGQRVRFARALLRSGVRLALLDEPFRGLERDHRRRLLRRARAAWSAATLLCITHDIEETLDFDLVVVLEAGRVVETGAPRVLAHASASRYARLLSAERDLRHRLWSDRSWRKLWLEAGRLVAEPPMRLVEGEERSEAREAASGERGSDRADAEATSQR